MEEGVGGLGGLAGSGFFHLRGNSGQELMRAATGRGADKSTERCVCVCVGGWRGRGGSLGVLIDPLI